MLENNIEEINKILKVSLTNRQILFLIFLKTQIK